MVYPPACRRSPDQVLTGTGVDQLRFMRPTTLATKAPSSAVDENNTGEDDCLLAVRVVLAHGRCSLLQSACLLN